MALSGRVNGNVTNKSNIFSFYFDWSAEQSISENASYITVTTYWSTNSRSYTFDTVSARPASITIDGTETSISKRFVCNPWSSDGIYQIQTVTRQKVEHNNDGTKTITITASANGYASTYGPSSSINAPCTASATITLDTIPRATTISATDAMIGSVSTIVLEKKAGIFIHDLYYKVGNENYIPIVTGIVFNYNWTVPDLYSKIPNDTQIQVTIKCETYNGSELIGTHETTMWASINPSVCRPELSKTIVNEGGNTRTLTGSTTKFIKGYSNAVITANATTKKSATLNEYRVVCGSKSSTSQNTTLQTIENNTLNFYVKDSRQLTPSAGYPITQQINMLDYFSPKLTSILIERTEQTSTEIKANISGQFWKSSFGSVNNTIKYAWRSKNANTQTWGNWSSYTTISTSNNNFSISNLSLGSSYATNSSYDFEFKFVDALGNLDSTKVVTTGTRNVTVSTPILEIYEDNIIANSDVEVMGIATIGYVQPKNILKLFEGSVTYVGRTWTIKDNTLTMTGVSTGERTITLLDGKFDTVYAQYVVINQSNSIELEAGTYTLSVGNNYGLWYMIGDIGQSYEQASKRGVLGETNPNLSYTFTITSPKRLALAAYSYNTAGETKTLANIQLEKGNMATPFEKHWDIKDSIKFNDSPTTGIDFNNYKIRGQYSIYGSNTNAPISDINIATLEVIPYSQDWILQRLTCILADGSKQNFQRHFYNGTTWSYWYREDLESYIDSSGITSGIYWKKYSNGWCELWGNLLFQESQEEIVLNFPFSMVDLNYSVTLGYAYQYYQKLFVLYAPRSGSQVAIFAYKENGEPINHFQNVSYQIKGRWK